MLERYREILNADSLDLSEKIVCGICVHGAISLWRFPYRRELFHFSILRELLNNLSEDELKQFSKWNPQILFLSSEIEASKFLRFLHYEFNDVYNIASTNAFLKQEKEWAKVGQRIEEIIERFQELLPSPEAYPKVGTQEWKEFLISLLERILEPLWKMLLDEAQKYGEMENGIPFLVTDRPLPWEERIIRAVAAGDAEAIKKEIAVSKSDRFGIKIIRRSFGL